MIRFILFICSLVLAVPIQAIYDPFSVPNNKYGMHIADFNDIADVAPLVNSTGGDWGYITLVSSDDDRNIQRWQRMFDQMRRLHLIPLVRIATHVEKDYWVKPNPVDFDSIVSFFNSLNWPTQNRYVILYNEPNHAKEWGNLIDPEGYAKTLVEFSRKFKAASEDFFILPAGLDVSAGTDALSLDARMYLDRMVSAQPDLLQQLDGWTSHSYPNPGFSGSPFATGRGTLRSYTWELGYLQKLGLTKSLPIFITETGWTHAGPMSSELVGANLQIATTGAWTDTHIVAITPFVFNYQASPFDVFSFKRMSEQGGFYPQYDMYKSIEKSKGRPLQKEAYALVEPILPLTLVVNGSYTLKTQVVNNGQGILSSDGYEIKIEGDVEGFIIVAEVLPTLEPGEKGLVQMHLKAPQTIGSYDVTLGIKRFDQLLGLQTQSIRVVPPPSLVITATLGWRRKSQASDAEVLVYDEDRLLHKFTGLAFKDEAVRIEGLANILPGRPYRIVLLVPYYLPRQTIQALEATDTNITMKRMLPLDFNRDGALNLQDLWSMIQLKPNFILDLFFSA